MKCIGPKAKDADSWIVIWEELHELRLKSLSLKVMRKAEELAKEGAMMDSLDKARTELDDALQAELNILSRWTRPKPSSTTLARSS